MNKILFEVSQLTLIAFLTVMLSGCEPFPGKVLEEKSKKVGGLEIALVRHAEGT
jgi:hypothetical protein